MSVDVFVFGCSHAARLQKGAEVLGLAVAGGGMMRGRLWDEGRFAVSAAGDLVLEDETGAARLAAALAVAGVARIADLKVPVVTTLGFQFDVLLDAVAPGYAVAPPAPDDDRQFLPRDVFEAYVLERRAKLVGLVGWLVSHGLTVVAVTPPPRHPAAALAAACEEVAGVALERAGAEVHRTRDWALDASGGLDPVYAAQKDGDRVHGNGFFGACAMARVAPRIGLDDRIDRAALDGPAAFDARALERRRTPL